MKYSFALILLLLRQVCISQQCDCKENFLYMKEKVTKNYVGFSYKVTPSVKSRFDHFTDSLETLAPGAGNGQCLQLMRTWLGFFNDLHMSVSLKDNTLSSNAVRELFAGTEKVALTEQAFISYLESNKKRLDPLEGIWEDERGVYRIGFIRDKTRQPDQFIGFILKADSVYWMPGQVKARVKPSGGGSYTAIYFLTRDHSALKAALTLRQNTLDAGIFGHWFKKFPAGGTQDTGSFESSPRNPAFRVLDDRNCLLVIPGSGLDDKKIVDSLLQANDPVIQKRENLIIDLRNNLGGSTLTFEKLLPLLYTQPIINRGASVLATDDNIKYYYSQYDLPNISDSMKNVFKRDAAALREHEGTIYALWPDDTIRRTTILAYPKHVSIIINEYCASSAELFLLQAKQSAKVTIFGKHTIGAVDYSDAVTMPMPCGLFSLRYSTSRTNRLPAEPLDNIGIQPDIPIPDNTLNWIEFVQSKNNSD